MSGMRLVLLELTLDPFTVLDVPLVLYPEAHCRDMWVGRPSGRVEITIITKTVTASQKNNSELFAVKGTQHRRPVQLFLRLQQQRFLCTELFLNYSSSSCARARDSVQMAPGGAENTHWNTHK